MPLPILTKASWIQQMITEARTAKQFAQNGINATLAGPVSANAILDLSQRLSAAKTNVFAPGMAVSGVPAALATELGINEAAATSAVNTLVSAIDGTITWITSNFPAANGYIQKDALNADGSVSVRTFTTVQTAGLRTQLQNIVDAVG